jgi:hypothetical protein
MPVEQFLKWKQKKILGASLKIVAPSGQYDPTKLINWGIDRWAFKPELGYSQRWGNLVLDAYGGVWFYTENPQSFNVPFPVPQTEAPVGSFEGHFSYDFSKIKGRRFARLGVAGWQLLVGRHCFGFRSTQSENDANQFTYRSKLFLSLFQAPVHQDVVQRWHVQPLRRKLPERASGMAILVDWNAMVEDYERVPRESRQSVHAN